MLGDGQTVQRNLGGMLSGVTQLRAFLVSSGESQASLGFLDQSGVVSMVGENAMSCTEMKHVLLSVIHMLHKTMNAWEAQWQCQVQGMNSVRDRCQRQGEKHEDQAMKSFDFYMPNSLLSGICTGCCFLSLSLPMRTSWHHYIKVGRQFLR